MQAIMESTTELAGQRTVAINELQLILKSLQDIESQEEELLHAAQDRESQAVVCNQLAKIEKEQRAIVDQLNFLKKERIMAKTRQVQWEQQKLQQMMMESDLDEEAAISTHRSAANISTPRSAVSNPRSYNTPNTRSSGYGTPASTTNINGSTWVSPMGQMRSSISAHSLARQSSLAMHSDQGSPYSLRSGTMPSMQRNYSSQAFNQMYQPPQVYQPPQNMQLPQGTQAQAPKVKKVIDYSIAFAPKRQRDEDDSPAKPVDDNEFGTDPKAKVSKNKKQVIVSGGLCGFKIAPDLLTRSYSFKKSDE